LVGWLCFLFVEESVGHPVELVTELEVKLLDMLDVVETLFRELDVVVDDVVDEEIEEVVDDVADEEDEEVLEISAELEVELEVELEAELDSRLDEEELEVVIGTLDELLEEVLDGMLEDVLEANGSNVIGVIGQVSPAIHPNGGVLSGAVQSPFGGAV
jgi:hypothetical protein